jgi:hypothetical protein
MKGEKEKERRKEGKERRREGGRMLNLVVARYDGSNVRLVRVEGKSGFLPL